MLSNDPVAEMTIMDPDARAPATTGSGFLGSLGSLLGSTANTLANAYANAAAAKIAGINKQPATPAQAVQDSASQSGAGSLLSSPWVIGGAAVAVGLLLVVALRKN